MSAATEIEMANEAEIEIDLAKNTFFHRFILKHSVIKHYRASLPIIIADHHCRSLGLFINANIIPILPT